MSTASEVSSSTGDGSAGSQSVLDGKIAEINESNGYTHIVIGTGMGGGALIRELVANKRNKVLVLEKGSTPRLTHCLNTARKHFNTQSQDPPGRDNELAFNKEKTGYNTGEETLPEDDPSYCGGGSYFAIGGRSLFWSLKAPEITKEKVWHNFPYDVAQSLWDRQITVLNDDPLLPNEEGWYTKAARILANSPPGDHKWYPIPRATPLTLDYMNRAETTLLAAIEGFGSETPKVTPRAPSSRTEHDATISPKAHTRQQIGSSIRWSEKDHPLLYSLAWKSPSSCTMK